MILKQGVVRPSMFLKFKSVKMDAKYKDKKCMFSEAGFRTVATKSLSFFCKICPDKSSEHCTHLISLWFICSLPWNIVNSIN